MFDPIASKKKEEKEEEEEKDKKLTMDPTLPVFTGVALPPGSPGG